MKARNLCLPEKQRVERSFGLFWINSCGYGAKKLPGKPFFKKKREKYAVEHKIIPSPPPCPLPLNLRGE
jgi:hypothetical protein